MNSKKNRRKLKPKSKKKLQMRLRLSRLMKKTVRKWLMTMRVRWLLSETG